MRLVDVVNQLRLILPKYTDRFSNSLSIISMVASGGVLTITTAGEHGLSSNQLVTLSSVKTQTPISAVSQDGLIFTFTTASDHDLTYGWPEHDTIELTGFTDTAWNGSFTLVSVPNRRNFKLQSTNTVPALNTNEKLLEIRIDGVNGSYAAMPINSTTFSVSGDFEDGTYIGGSVSRAVRVAGSVDITRAISQYTAQGVTDLWGFVVMHDAEVSKNRHALSDATSTPTTGTALRERIIDGFSFYVVVNTSQDIAAEQAVDICRHELLTPVLKSVYGARFTTGLSGETDFRTVLTGHGFASYNRAIYVHVYTFELSMDLTDQDAVDVVDTRAYRDTDYTQTIGTQDMTVLINQDDVPLTP